MSYTKSFGDFPSSVLDIGYTFDVPDQQELIRIIKGLDNPTICEQNYFPKRWKEKRYLRKNKKNISVCRK